MDIVNEPRSPSPRWGVFAHPAFRVLWAASFVSNIGIAMFDTASGWFMTNLDPSPMVVSLVQTATTLPLFLLTIPAGALTDILDSRRLLLFVSIAVAVVSAAFAVLVSLGFATPTLLLATTFALGVGGALCAPAWVSIAPLLVPRSDLDAAVGANTAGYNMSRAIGPAIGGLAIAMIGVAIPFWAYAATNLLVVAALLWWRSPPRGSGGLPAERLTSAIRTGVRHARNNAHLHATLVRTLFFFPFASAYWALLPLIARSHAPKGPEYYGLLLGGIGAGAIFGSLILDRLKRTLGPDGLVAAATLGTAAALALFAWGIDPAVTVLACFLAGACWTLSLATLYVSAQVALPDWVRGRGLAIFLTIIFGASTLGSAGWGQVASMEGLRFALLAAAAGALVFLPLGWGAKLQTGLGVDLAPSMHWSIPKVERDLRLNQGPVLVTLEYRTDPKDHKLFLQLMEEVGRERKRDGAYAWGIFEDIGAEGRFVETFLIESWLELMHQHERVTAADRMLEEKVRKLLLEAPHISRMISVRRDNSYPATGPDPRAGPGWALR